MLQLGMVTEELGQNLIAELGWNSDKIKRVYVDFGISKYAFERHFVTEEPFENALMKKLEAEFILYQKAVLMVLAKGQ